MKNCLTFTIFYFFIFAHIEGQESLKPISDPIFGGIAPINLDKVWAGYDPSSEALNSEILHSWTEDHYKADNSKINLTIRVVRFDIGTFKGQKSKMVGLYAFPTNSNNLPAILECHGGGQFANINYVKNNAMNGYACLSINWGGSDIPLGTEGTWSKPNTEWKGVVANQTTTNDHWDGTNSVQPTQYTIDSIVSPRNNNWFIVTLAARRAITYLCSQSEVDKTKIGMYGFSMGGALTFSTASIDKRIKAAISMAAAKVDPGANAQTMQGYDFWMNCISAYPYAKKLSCPMIFHNASNDFHGVIDDVEQLVDSSQNLTSLMYRYTREVNKNHSNNPENDVNYILWFNQHLKGTFSTPKTPIVSIVMNGNVLNCTVNVDNSASIKAVKLWYTIEEKSNLVAATARVWSEATLSNSGSFYTGTLPTVDTTTHNLRVFSNVDYFLSTPTKSGWGYTTDFHSISSPMVVIGKTNATKKYTLSIAAVNGLVNASPNQISYEYGAKVTLTAVPNPGYEFSHWTQHASGNSNPFVITMDGNKGAEAIFVQKQITGDSVYLSDIQWNSASNGVLEVQKDKNFNGNPLAIKGTVYNKGLGTHAISSISYTLNGNYESFQSIIGIDDACNGNVVFIVVLDGKTIYTSPIINGGNSGIPIDLDISGGNQLILHVNDGGDGIGCDHANWAYAKIIKAKTVTNMASLHLNSLIVFPNPAENRIYILSDIVESQYKIHSSTGQHVLSGKGNTVDISCLDKGFYLITINEYQSVKFLKF